MQSVAEIIDSCDNNPTHILEYAIANSHIDLFIEFFTVDNLSSNILCRIEKKPSLYPIFESVLKTNSLLVAKISDMLSCSALVLIIPEKNNIPLLNIILEYLSTDAVIQQIIYYSIITNNTNFIDIIFTYGYDIRPVFDTIKIPHAKIKFDTIIYLEKYNINIFPHIDDLGAMFFNLKDLPGLKFCLDNGANPNHILYWLENSNIDTIKCLLEYDIDINCLTINQIKNIIINEDANLNIIIYLVENGLIMNDYFDNLMIHTINTNCPQTAKYLISLGADIHFDDNLLLFCACKIGNIKFVELLLEYGAIANDSILLFVETDLTKYDNDELYIQNGYHNWFKIAKILIKHGAIITDPKYLFCIYLCRLLQTPMDEELFTILLDLGIDLNTRVDFRITGKTNKYILESVVCCHYPELTKLCLKYGADPYINNHGPLREAIRWNNKESIKILLDLGSTLDSDL